MTEDEQRIEIAKACGWKSNGLGPVGTLHDPKGCTCFDGRGCRMPDYLNDLNAMNEAFSSLSEAEKTVFAETLCAVVGGYVVYLGYYPGETVIEWNSIAVMINATASQRAEAFLRAKNLWK